MTKMLQTATNSSCIAFNNHFKDMRFIYDVMFDTWRDFGGVVEPMEWNEALRFKDKDTTNGFPLNYMETNDYAQLVESYGYDGLAEEMSRLEAILLEGGSLPPAVWKPFPKEDKYSTKKVVHNDLRMVSTGPLFLLVLCRRWFYTLMERLERKINQAYLVTSNEQFQKKVYHRLPNRKSFGIDYSAYDKNTVSGSTYLSLELLYKLHFRSIPVEIFEYVSLNIVQPLSVLVRPDGYCDAYCLGGSNPSGQLFTSWCNTVSHVSHNALFLYQTYRVNPKDYLCDLSHLKSVATGDDGIETVPARWTDEQVMDFAERLARFIDEKFSIPAKLDLLETSEGKKPFPPGMLAPYLNNVMIDHEPGESYYLLPIHPERFLPSMIYYTGNDILKFDELKIARSQGIFDQIKPLIFHELINPDLPRSKIVRVLTKIIAQNGFLIPKPTEIIFSKVLVRVIPEGQLVI